MRCRMAERLTRVLSAWCNIEMENIHITAFQFWALPESLLGALGEPLQRRTYSKVLRGACAHDPDAAIAVLPRCRVALKGLRQNVS